MDNEHGWKFWLATGVASLAALGGLWPLIESVNAAQPTTRIQWIQALGLLAFVAVVFSLLWKNRTLTKRVSELEQSIEARMKEAENKRAVGMAYHEGEFNRHIVKAMDEVAALRKFIDTYNLVSAIANRYRAETQDAGSMSFGKTMYRDSFLQQAREKEWGEIEAYIVKNYPDMTANEVRRFMRMALHFEPQTEQKSVPSN